MKKKEQQKTPLYVPVLWYITTLMWTITFSVNLSRLPYSGEGLVILQGMTVVVSFAAAVANTVRYLKTKDME
ncbi:MAG: hypothetical protein IKU20_02135 [Lachnospiraceae bacterium]|nr:hypothetical protein [Lachnospiraceae bacterium]